MNDQQAKELLHKVAAELYPHCVLTDAEHISPEHAAKAADKAYVLALEFVKVAKQQEGNPEVQAFFI
jgi:hypothetical protein